LLRCRFECPEEKFPKEITVVEHKKAVERYQYCTRQHTSDRAEGRGDYTADIFQRFVALLPEFVQDLIFADAKFLIEPFLSAIEHREDLAGNGGSVFPDDNTLVYNKP